MERDEYGHLVPKRRRPISTKAKKLNGMSDIICTVYSSTSYRFLPLIMCSIIICLYCIFLIISNKSLFVATKINNPVSASSLESGQGYIDHGE